MPDTSGTVVANVSSIYRIELLQGTPNYPSWKVQMVDILTDSGLEDHVEPAADDAAAKLRETDTAWIKADRRALSAIRLRVAPDVVHHIQGETTALSAWEMLSHLFELKGQMGIILARHKFYSTRAPADLALEPHIKLMRQFQGELKSLGQEVTDGDFSVALLSSLPPDWDAFVRSTLSGTTAPDSKTTISAILTEERRRTDRDGENDHSQALIAHHRRYPKYRPDHTSSAPTPTASSSSWKNAICHRCGGKGHLARVCPSEASDAPDQANFAYEENEPAEEYAF